MSYGKASKRRAVEVLEQESEVVKSGVRCSHCGNMKGNELTGEPYPNGNLRYVCGSCNFPFIVRVRHG